MGEKYGIEVGDKNTRLETAKNMLKDNLAMATIIKYTSLSKEEIKALKTEK